MYYHYYTSNQRFAFASDVASSDLQYGYNEIPPPSGLSKWSGAEWVVLTTEEIKALDDSDSVEQPGSVLSIPFETVPNTIPLWGGELGDRLVVSPLIFTENCFKAPKINTSEYLLNGEPLIPVRDIQEAIAISMAETGDDDLIQVPSTLDGQEFEPWEQIPNLALVTNNLENATYRIEIETIVSVSKKNKPVEMAVFVNGALVEDSLVSLFLGDDDSDVSINWTTSSVIEPGAKIQVWWRGNNNKNYKIACKRRLLRIEQQWHTN